MARYRKKPVEIEAWPVSDLLDSAELPGPIVAAHERGEITFATSELYVRTLEGVMTGNRADILIQGVNGEFYPCKPDIFRQTYDSV